MIIETVQKTGPHECKILACTVQKKKKKKIAPTTTPLSDHMSSGTSLPTDPPSPSLLYSRPKPHILTITIIINSLMNQLHPKAENIQSPHTVDSGAKTVGIKQSIYKIMWLKKGGLKRQSIHKHWSSNLLITGFHQ